MVEPVEDGGKANEAVEGDCEVFVARRDAAVTFNPAEEADTELARVFLERGRESETLEKLEAIGISVVRS